jgi:hypothetical protein
LGWARVSHEDTLFAQTPPAERYQYSLDEEHQVVVVVVHERLTADDLIAIVNRQIDDKAWAFGLLYDYRTTWVPPSPQEIVVASAYVHQQIRMHGQRGPVALVVAGGPVVDVAATYALNARGFAVAVFWGLPEARNWLSAQQIAALSGDAEDD